MLRFLGFVFAAGFIAFLGVMAAGAYVVWDVSRDLPEYSRLAEYEPAVMTRVHAGDGSLIAEYARERRLFVPASAMPERLIEAFMSAEDKTFFEHSGLDIWSIARAAITNVENMMGGGDHRLVGASTITQQVAKNFLLSSEQTLTRKLKEALLALRIERTFSKEQILELYLNEIYLGYGSYGVAAAALNYFGKSLNELDLAEMAYLAALPKAPNNYHPVRDHDRAVGRRNWVIERMLENGYVTREEAEKAMAESLEVTPRPVGAELFSAEFFAEEVRRKVRDMYGEEKLYEGGLSIRTTLDPKLQIFARQALTRGLIEFDRERGWRGPVQRVDVSGDWAAALSGIDVAADLAPWRLAVVLSVSEESAEIGLRPRAKAGADQQTRERGRIPLNLMSWAREATGSGLGPEITAASDVLSPGDVVYVAAARNEGDWHLVQVPEIQGGLVAMDPHTGRVLALVGGFSYGMSQFDRAVQADRQPGSAFKPFVYAAALDNGYTPASVVLDAPISFEMDNGEIWAPRNYSRKFYGPSTLRRGVELSRNVMTVRLAKDMGIKTVADYAERFGIYDNLSPVLAMALGAGETSLLRLTAGYAMLDNGGKRIEPTLIDRIQDRYGDTVYRHDKRECTGCDAERWNGQPEPELVDVREQVINPYTAYQITSMLEGVVQRGTGRIVSETVSKPLAGKTGTTNDYKDAWFVGFAPDLAVGVYVGYDNPRSMGRSATGGQVAAPIFADFMKMALKGKPATPFRVPSGIQLIPINPKNGQRAAYGGDNVILEAFKPGNGPSQDTYIIGAGQSYGTDQSFGADEDRAPSLGGPVVDGGLGTGTGGLY